MLNLFQELHKKAVLYDQFRYDSFSMLFYIYNNMVLYNNMILHLLELRNGTTAKQLLDKLSFYFENQERNYYHRARLLNLKGLTLYVNGSKKRINAY